MEMCDYDLDDLLKLPDSFKEEQIIIDFLYQLGKYNNCPVAN